MATKNGIEYDLARSNYKCTWEGLEFYFSSATHLDKFVKNIEKRIEWLNDSMGRRFHYIADFSLLAILQLYFQIETRGFLIKDSVSEVIYPCHENITLNGLKISERN